MKEYIIQLYIDFIKCSNYFSEECHEDFNCFRCYNCTALKIINKSGDVIIDNLDNFLNNLDNVEVLNFILETNDNFDENNFLSYFYNKNSNYRVTDLHDDLIVAYSDEDFSMLEDLIDKYGSENVCLYNKDYNKKDLKMEIVKLRLQKLCLLLLNLTFGTITGFSLFKLVTNNDVLSVSELLLLIVLLINVKAALSIDEEAKGVNASIEVKKRLLKKLENDC